MEELARHWPQADPAREGLRLHLSGGWAWIRPSASSALLKVRTEGDSVELAAELCDFVLSEARRWTGSGPKADEYFHVFNTFSPKGAGDTGKLMLYEPGGM